MYLLCIALYYNALHCLLFAVCVDGTSCTRRQVHRVRLCCSRISLCPIFLPHRLWSLLHLPVTTNSPWQSLRRSGLPQLTPSHLCGAHLQTMVQGRRPEVTGLFVRGRCLRCSTSIARMHTSIQWLPQTDRGIPGPGRTFRFAPHPCRNATRRFTTAAVRTAASMWHRLAA